MFIMECQGCYFQSILFRYGDVTPKTFLGRIIDIIWVLVGAIVMSLFTGLMISTMQAAFDGSKCKDIAGKEVRLKERKLLSGQTFTLSTDLIIRADVKFPSNQPLLVCFIKTP